MNANRAIAIAEKKNPQLKFTGNGYEYDGDYFLELAPKDYNMSKDGMMVDAHHKVDGTTGKVTRYNPMIDGMPDASRINML